MWWTDQTLNKSLNDSEKNEWNFRVWHGHVKSVYIQRIFFWTSNKEQTGLIEFKDDQSLHIKRLRDRIIKVTKNEAYRNKYLTPLEFPIEKVYEDYFKI